MLKRLALFGVLLLAAVSSRAQEIEGSGKNGGALFSPVDYLQVTVPVTERVAVNTYGFYLGNVRASIALLEVPVALQKHFSVIPSYLFINVPPSGLSLLTGEPASGNYHEHQFRLAGTISGSWHHFNLADRNMYVRRYTPWGGLNRYRNKVYVARSVIIGSYRFNSFVFDEIYHDFAPGNWLRRSWAVAGVDLPINRYLTFQASYIHQSDQFLRSANFLGTALIIKTGRLLPREKGASRNSNRALNTADSAERGHGVNAPSGLD
jgi:Protein of unknown function (DUF2490)